VRLAGLTLAIQAGFIPIAEKTVVAVRILRAFITGVGFLVAKRLATRRDPVNAAAGILITDSDTVAEKRVVAV
jgi:hypothetical protein